MYASVSEWKRMFLMECYTAMVTYDKTCLGAELASWLATVLERQMRGLSTQKSPGD